jgi:hypothetical protein
MLLANEDESNATYHLESTLDGAVQSSDTAMGPGHFGFTTEQVTGLGAKRLATVPLFQILTVQVKPKTRIPVRFVARKDVRQFGSSCRVVVWKNGQIDWAHSLQVPLT